MEEVFAIPMIEAAGLNKIYGSFAAIKDVTFAVPKGQVAAFLGPNGAGKSTTMKILTGYLSPTSGQARIAGIDVTTDRIRAAERLGYLPENGPLYPDMTPLGLLKFFGRARGLGGVRLEFRFRGGNLCFDSAHFGTDGTHLLCSLFVGLLDFGDGARDLFLLALGFQFQTARQVFRAFCSLGLCLSSSHGRLAASGFQFVPECLHVPPVRLGCNGGGFAKICDLRQNRLSHFCNVRMETVDLQKQIHVSCHQSDYHSEQDWDLQARSTWLVSVGRGAVGHNKFPPRVGCATFRFTLAPMPSG